MFNNSKPQQGNGGLFGNLNNQKKEEKPRSRLKTINIALSIVGVSFYPFMIVGSIFFILYKFVEKQFRKKNIMNMDYVTPFEEYFWVVVLITLVFQFINIFLFVAVIPRGYFSSYLIFPMNLLNTTLVFNYQTILALLLGGSGASLWMISFTLLLDKRKVVSKKEKMDQVKNSKEYKKRQENKFKLADQETKRHNEEYRLAKETNDIRKLEELRNLIYIGTDEHGFPYYMTWKELNQHALAVGTTGSGKTTLLQLFMEHCIKFDIPLLFFDGKGAKDSQESLQEIAELYGKEITVFSDKGTIAYNPVKYGNSVEIKDKLVELASSESIYYTATGELLLMNTIQLIDEFKIKRTLKNLANHFLPRNVLLLFAKDIQEHKPDLFVFEVKKKKEKKKKPPKKAKNEEDIQQLDDEISQLDEELVAVEQVETVEVDPNNMILEELHYVLARDKYYLSKERLRLFDILFTRYEHKKNVFYLYATSESLQTHFNQLLDSELAHLFDTEENKNELDLLEATRNNEIMYVSLNGLIYSKFIKSLAQFFVSDINHLASVRYEMSEDYPFGILFDEPSAYLTAGFIDTANKTRGAGIHAIFTPQTLADIEAIDEILLKQLVGNVNTYMVGQTNEPTEVDYWSKLFGSYEDIDVTEMTTQEDGYSDVNKTDWVGERGTKRDVNRFIVEPDTIKGLRKGEYIIYRKGDDNREPIRKVFIRKVI